MVRITFIGSLKTYFGYDHIDVHIDRELNLREFVALLHSLDSRFKEIISDDCNPKPGYIVLLNGVDIRVYTDPAEIKVRDSDEIVLIPVVHGG